MNRRIAVVAGLALLLGALAFTFAPSNTDDAKCGQWFAPEWEKAKSKAMAQEALDQVTGQFPEVDAQSQVLAGHVERNYRQCTNELATRRNASLGLIAGALLIPGAVLYVGKREDQTATP